MFGTKKTYRNALDWIGCAFGVDYCNKKHKYNDQSFKAPSKDYTAGYKYGWTNEGCPPYK